MRTVGRYLLRRSNTSHRALGSQGFFYDSYLGGEPFRPTMNDDVEKRVKKICDEKQAHGPKLPRPTFYARADRDHLKLLTRSYLDVHRCSSASS